MQNPVGVDLELHADARLPLRGGLKLQLEAPQFPVVARHFALSLQNADEHGPLPGHGVREHLARLRRERRVARDDDVHQAAERLDAERKRRHVEQHHVAHRPGENARLDRRAERHRLVGVLRKIRLAAKKLRDKPPHERHPRLTANEDHLIEIGRLQLRVGERAQAVCAGPLQDRAGKPLQLLARHDGGKALPLQQEREIDPRLLF